MATMNDFFNKTVTPKIDTEQMHVRNISLSSLVESKFQYRVLTQNSIEELADNILLDGKVMQPLVVRKIGGDTFEILSGHKRFNACKYLVNECKEDKFKMVPCYVVELDDVRAEWAVVSTNGYGVKTSAEIMSEIKIRKRLITEHPDAFPKPKGVRTIEIIAKDMGLSTSQIGNYEKIDSNISDEGREAFKSGKIDQATALELSNVNHETQKEILDSGAKTKKDVRTYIEKNVEPTEEEIRIFWKNNINGEVPQYMELIDFLKNIGKSHTSILLGDISFTSTPRGVSINNKNEITWNRYISLAKDIGLELEPTKAELDKAELDKAEPDKAEPDKAEPDNESVKQIIEPTLAASPEEVEIIQDKSSEKVDPNEVDSNVSPMCPHCGNRINNFYNPKYCGNCGGELTWH